MELFLTLYEGEKYSQTSESVHHTGGLIDLRELLFLGLRSVLELRDFILIFSKDPLPFSPMNIKFPTCVCNV